MPATATGNEMNSKAQTDIANVEFIHFIARRKAVWMKNGRKPATNGKI